MRQIILKIFISWTFILTLCPLFAQMECDSNYQKVVNERDNLYKRVKQLEKDINRLRKDMEKLSNDKVHEKNKELNLEVEHLCQDTVMLNQRLLELNKILSDAQITIDEKEKELNLLRPYRDKMLEKMLSDYSFWKSELFSELEMSVIENTLNDIRKYGGDDTSFMDLFNKVQHLRNELDQFTTARGLLYQPFNKQKRKVSRHNMSQLKERYASQPQFEDLNIVDELLRDYEGNVYLFKELIVYVDKEIASQREIQNKTAALNMLKVALSDSDQQEIMKSIRTVPYLDELLTRYLNDLENNPLVHSIIEKEVEQMLSE